MRYWIGLSQKSMKMALMLLVLLNKVFLTANLFKEKCATVCQSA